MSWRVRIVHSTGYRYSSPVVQSFNEVRMTPRGDRRQEVVVNRVETTPATRAYRYTDYWRNAVTSFDLHAPHTELKIIGSSVVETASASEPVTTATWGRLRAEDVVDRYTEFLEPTRTVPRNRELAAVGRELKRRVGPAEAVLGVANWVHEHLTYQQGRTSVHSSAVDAWQAKEGVCQDYAHLSLLLLRSMGIPARYVSGYLHTNPDGEVRETVKGESHAWIEAWTGGWWGYDPTNAIPVGQRHIWVALGRDYSDVAPVKGIFSGGAASALEVDVEITRLA
ncbi:transglutaminase family protein [Allokutzneria oryzae]|uniref:Transglutaminase domain-containing protein n=1 Tax=Allokutzneria oryzae TaxID=1378989 RepID=A0ABV5ZUI4_9PSEU